MLANQFAGIVAGSVHGSIGVSIRNACREPVDVTVYQRDAWSIEKRIRSLQQKSIEICRGLDWCGYSSWTTPRAHVFSVAARGVDTGRLVHESNETVTVSGTRPVNARLVMKMC